MQQPCYSNQSKDTPLFQPGSARAAALVIRRQQLAILLVCLFAFMAEALAEEPAANLAAPSSVDPWEKFNRPIFAFDDALDRRVLRPVAKGYDTYLPRAVKRGVRNVLDNIGTPAIAINQLLQGKPRKAFSDLGRFAINSTFGLLGLVDAASRAGIAKHEEDFGQTLVVWGVAQGPYFVIPFRGPSTVTHTGGMIVDWILNPLRFINSDPELYTAVGLDIVSSRADLLGADVLITGDRYLFLRDAYLQRRQFLILDGAVQDDPFADEYDDWDQ